MNTGPSRPAIVPAPPVPSDWLHECSFPTVPPHSFVTPGPCKTCGKTWTQNEADTVFEAACRVVAAAYPVPGADFLTALDGTWWHAVPGGRAREAVARHGLDPSALTACGRTARLALRSPAPWPETGSGVPVPEVWKCLECAWAVAADRGILMTEAERLAPAGDEREALARCGVSPLLAAQTAATLIAAAADPGRTPPHPGELLQLLAAVGRHRPHAAWPAACEEGECGHAGPGPDEDWPGPGAACPASAVCWGCTLTAGAWAGAYEGKILGGSRITAPCQVMTSLADHAARLRKAAR